MLACHAVLAGMPARQQHYRRQTTTTTDAGMRASNNDIAYFRYIKSISQSFT